jgi:hypothetical protein
LLPLARHKIPKPVKQKKELSLTLWYLYYIILYTTKFRIQLYGTKKQGDEPFKVWWFGLMSTPNKAG